MDRPATSTNSTSTDVPKRPESPAVPRDTAFFFVRSRPKRFLEIRGQLGARSGATRMSAFTVAPMPLTNVAISKAKPTGKTQRLFDGGGMYLEISPAGGKWWRLKYRHGGKEKRLSLGTFPDKEGYICADKPGYHATSPFLPAGQ